MIQRLHHAQIAVPKNREAEAREFYLRVLGLKEIPKPASLQTRGGFWMQCGHQEIHIGIDESGTPPSPKAHLAFEVSDLVRWKVKLGDAGLAIVDGVPIPGYHRFEFRDPFGNRTEFIQQS